MLNGYEIIETEQIAERVSILVGYNPAADYQSQYVTCYAIKPQGKDKPFYRFPHYHRDEDCAMDDLRQRTHELKDIAEALKPGPRMIGEYEVLHSMTIGGNESVLVKMPSPPADNPNIRFGVFDVEIWPDFGVERLNCGTGYQDFHLALDEYFDRVTDYLSELKKEHLEHVEHGAGLCTIGADDCIPVAKFKDLKGLVLAVKASTLYPEYQTDDHQLILAKHGNGCIPSGNGTKIYCANLYDGKDAGYHRSHDIEGVVRPDKLPEWAKEKWQAKQESQIKSALIPEKGTAKRTPKNRDER